MAWLAVGRKLDILGFGWLEEHVAMAIAIKFTCCFACCCNIVSSLKIGLGNSFDGICPCLLYSVHFRFRYWWFLNFKGNWRVVEENADLSILIFFVAECVFDLRLASISSTCEVVVAHGNGNISVQVNLMVVKDDIGPAFATIDCKASILRNSVINCLWPYEVRHGLACHRAKLDILGFGWLEEHVAMAIAIKFTCCFACCCNIVSSLNIGLGDSFDGICPCLLCGANLLLWDRPVHGKSQVGSKCCQWPWVQKLLWGEVSAW